MKLLVNQNVNYANHTNSSAPKWSNSSAASDSLSTIVRNKIIVIPEVPTVEKEQKSDEQLTKRFT